MNNVGEIYIKIIAEIKILSFLINFSSFYFSDEFNKHKITTLI